MMATEYLFPNFLSDPDVYEAAWSFWRGLCQHVLGKYGQSAAWEPMPEETAGNGTPVRDGNPIYALVNRGQLKSVVVVQQDPEVHTKWDVAAWVNEFGDEFSEPGPIRELVFTSNLSRQFRSVTSRKR